MKHQPIPDDVDELSAEYSRATATLGAESLLHVLGPIIERQFKVLMTQLAQAPPELGPLLDLRAKIVHAHSIRVELEQLAKGKARAIDVINKVAGLTLSKE